MKLLIGTGFYSTAAEHGARETFFRLWFANTARISSNVVTVDNSERGFYLPHGRIIRCEENLGHASAGTCARGPLLGWSMSWILPALMAYAEGSDFVYKEQDCLAFGDWLPWIMVGQMAFGRNSQMPCEQSLFWIKHDFILVAVRDYLLLDGHDGVIVTEHKFRRLMDIFPPGTINFFDLPGGRDRPLPDHSKPFYGQRFTEHELQGLRDTGLV